MDNLELNAAIRTGRGKSEAGRMRKKDLIPCIMYGVDKTSISLEIEKLELEKMLSSSHSVIDLKYDGKIQGVVVRDIQYHPVKGNIIHVDFLRVKAGQEIKISVPIIFVGESAGIKAGGVFQEIKSQLSIVTLPRHLPEVIEVDISELEVNDAFHVSDLHLENITVEDDPSETLCSVVPPKKVEEPVAAEEGEIEEVEADEEEAAEPEVITAKKSEEEEKE